MADWVLYDNQASGTSATTITFFNDDEGTSKVYNTDMPQKAQLDYDFEVHEIILRPSSDIARADLLKLVEGSVIVLKIGDVDVIKIPTFMCLGDFHFSTEGTAGTGEVMSASNYGGGFRLNEPIRIPANTTFKLNLELESALGTDTDLIAVLRGRR